MTRKDKLCYSRRYYLKNKVKANATSKRYYLENKKRLLKKMKRWRKNHPHFQRKLYRKNKEWYRARQRKWHRDHREAENIKYKNMHREIKRKTMLMYGGCCAACKTRELAVLSIDHINDDGAKDRRYKNRRFSYLNILKKKRDDLQVLCMNCQWRKRIYGKKFSTWKF